MQHVTADDGIRLYFEEVGSGLPILFIHEFAGDHRSWEPQLRFFARDYRCIAYNARGFPPSDVPAKADSYSQARAVADALAVLDGLGIEKAHIVGLSMGGFCALHFGLNHPDRAHSLVVAGCGYGAEPGQRDRFRAEALAMAQALERDGMEKSAERYAHGPTRVQYENKDPRGFAEFKRQFSEHSATGAANTMRGVQAERPSLYDLTGEMAALSVPTLVVTGDEDWPCLEPGLLMKRAIPTAALVVLPNTGHACNIEEPAAFNRALSDFFHRVERGRWPTRDPRAVTDSITGMK